MERWRDLEREKKGIWEKEDAGKGTLYRGNPNLEGRYFGFSKNWIETLFFARNVVSQFYRSIGISLEYAVERGTRMNLYKSSVNSFD